MFKLLFGALAFTMFFSCSDSDHKSEPFRLNVTVMGGGCGYTKEITLTDNKTKIVTHVGNCRGKDFTASYDTDKDKLALIKNKLDEVQFTKLNLVECFRCVDGVDYKMELNQGGKTYVNTIARRMSDVELTAQDKQLQDLQNMLDNL